MHKKKVSRGPNLCFRHDAVDRNGPVGENAAPLLLSGAMGPNFSIGEKEKNNSGKTWNGRP